MSDFWMQDREDMLRALWPTHKARQIADAIGNGCNRNMVIGKAHRLGLNLPEEERSRRQLSSAAARRGRRRPARRYVPRRCVLVECDGACA